MYKSVEQDVEDTVKALRKVVRECNTPAKARKFLIEIGIMEKDPKSPHKVRLAKRFR